MRGDKDRPVHAETPRRKQTPLPRLFRHRQQPTSVFGKRRLVETLVYAVQSREPFEQHVMHRPFAVLPLAREFETRAIKGRVSAGGPKGSLF